jgi:hypothetical protein
MRPGRWKPGNSRFFWLLRVGLFGWVNELAMKPRSAVNRSTKVTFQFFFRVFLIAPTFCKLSTGTAKQVNDRAIFIFQSDVIHVKKYVKGSCF